MRLKSSWNVESHLDSFDEMISTGNFSNATAEVWLELINFAIYMYLADSLQTRVHSERAPPNSVVALKD